MNKTKRNLIMASAIVNIIAVVANLIISILRVVALESMKGYEDYTYLISIYGKTTTNIVFGVIEFAIGLIGSILLLYSIRNKGKYFRRSYGVYVAGFVIIVVCGSFVSWLLLFISAFVPDIVVLNDKSELRREQKQEQKEEILQNRAYEEKKAKIEDLKRLRDAGVITEEEYKNKLFDLL